MNEETVVEQAEQQPEQATPEQVSSDMGAGFNKVRGIEGPAKADTDETPPAEVEPEPQAEEPPEPQALSQEELRAALAKLNELEQFRGQTAAETQKLHGKIGELNRTLQNARTSPTAANSEAHKAALQKLTSEYPELAETLAPLFDGRAAASVSTEQIQQIVQEQVGAVRAETNQTIQQLQAQINLTKAHPDWETIPSTPEYQKWFTAQPAEFQKQFNETWDTNFVARGLSEFKKWKSTTYAKAREKQARLDGAVTPTGVPGRGQAKLPDTAGMSIGFNRVRKPA